MSENIINMKKIENIFQNIQKKTEVLQWIANGVFIEFSEYLEDDVELLTGPVYLKILCNYNKEDELYTTVTNELFDQELDFSVDYKYELFREFIDNLEVIFTNEILNSVEFSKICEDNSISKQELNSKVSIYFDVAEEGFGLLLNKVDLF